ncbi:MAG TPA: polysaccharide deacetylase family protein [Blastocatellia bacterium]|nr:polysaccharide deacetylase family protein [Blastocatellia bacterium]
MAKGLRNRLARQAVILLYHRIADSASDPWSLCVSPRRFAEHLEVLAKHGYVMRLEQLARALGGRNLPHRAAVITFDDGYVDNLWNARPLLERYDLPATVFVATGNTGQGREFWWDELERLFLQPGTLPESLRLSINGSAHAWELGDATTYSPSDYALHSGWKNWQADPGPRQSLYRSVYRLLYPLPEDERRKALDELRAWAGAKQDGRPAYRALSPEEVVLLAQGGLIEIGAHTVTHSQLSQLPLTLQQAEIRESKARLEEILGRPVSSFAYPYGKRSDYTTETVALVREAGFICACSNFSGTVRRRTDRYQLPRFYVMDWDGEEFSRRLSSWFDSPD